ncbi:MAG: undecaprenyl/decaprenyl-phosphate alpha-N-acetylglucosaminyl 1-phosphate transferase, partial [Phycisphaerae bacterium]|nr:undecaprenyl/decaprenyl-phosphate alpha-N-acetylglucosaminyl 1-phosphate transferase [Phycisphaerae bacterium]
SGKRHMAVMYSPMEVLEGIWPLAILAYVVSVLLTPVVRWIAYRAKIVDRPDDLLKPHSRPIAYLGGLAVCTGFLTALIVGVFNRPDLHFLATTIGVATIAITLTGLLDDLLDLKPLYKVVGQVITAAILFVGLCSAGIHVSAARMFLLPLGFEAPAWLAALFSAGLTVVVVIAACNATNLLDGLDGLAGGVTGIIALGFVGLTVYLACYGHHLDPDRFRVILCLSMAGAVLGFLPYNAPPASIFLGDAGSMLLGFFVATMIMLFGLEGNARWFLAACVIFGLPIIDTALAVVRRVISGMSIFAGDRSHLYDQLVDRGMSVKKVVVLFYALAVFAAALGVAQAIFMRGKHALLMDLGILTVIAIIFVRMGMFRPNQHNTHHTTDKNGSEQG